MRSTDEPLVSVVMATYNTEYSMIREAVESVINQTYSNWELILIDDSSMEYNDFSFLDEYHDNRIKLYHNEENIGCTKCFNKGIRLSQGEYIARLDADDIALPRRFELQVKYLVKHPDIKVLSSVAYFFGKDSGIGFIMPAVYEYIRPLSLFRNIIAHSSVMIRRTLFDVDNMCYDESLVNGQDFDLWVRVIKTGDYIRQYPKCLVMIRTHNRQISAPGNNSIQARNLGLIRVGQLRESFDATDEDIRCEEAFLKKEQSDGATIADINYWIIRLLKENRTRKCFRQHYLKLAISEKYIQYIKGTNSYSQIHFLLRHMPIEFFQMMIIVIYRKMYFLVIKFYNTY
jgi:glycosyltransferase involved in cell wall biosynthesis